MEMNFSKLADVVERHPFFNGGNGMHFGSYFLLLKQRLPEEFTHDLIIRHFSCTYQERNR